MTFSQKYNTDPGRTEKSKTFCCNNQELLLPKYDIVFNTIFSGERGKIILADFLSAMLEQEEIAPNDLDIINSGLKPDSEKDLCVRIKEKSMVNITIISREYETMPNQEFDAVARNKNRCLYGAAEAVQNQLQHKDTYQFLLPTINLCILDFIGFAKDNRFFRTISLHDDESKEPMYNMLNLAFLELPKLKNPDSAHVENRRVQWAMFIAADNQEVLYELSGKNPNIKQAVALLQEVSTDKRVLDQYNECIKTEEVYNKYSKKGLGEDYVIHFAKLFARSYIDGQRNTKLRYANNMLEEGINISMISTVTGLSRQQIDQLQQEMGNLSHSFFAEAFVEGFSEGEHRANCQAVRAMLREGFDLSIISDITKLNQIQIAKLQKDNIL